MGETPQHWDMTDTGHTQNAPFNSLHFQLGIHRCEGILHPFSAIEIQPTTMCRSHAEIKQITWPGRAHT